MCICPFCALYIEVKAGRLVPHRGPVDGLFCLGSGYDAVMIDGCCF